MACKRRGFFAWFRLILLWAFLAVLGLQLWYFSHIVVWTFVNPGHTSFMQTRLAEMRTVTFDAHLTQNWVPYDRIALNLKRAVVAAEDANFVNHAGYEMQAIENAMQRNARKGRVTHGGSTITQQLAKNLFLSSSRSYLRKGQELVIAFMLEAVWSKQRILEVYLNVVEWGNGVYGAQAAAQYYYGVDASELSAYQAAKLAGMLPAPRYFDRNRNSKFLAKKAGTLTRRMTQVYVPR